MKATRGKVGGGARAAWILLGVALVSIGCGDVGDSIPHRSAKVYPGGPSLPPVQLAIHRSPRVYPPDGARVKEVVLEVRNDLADIGNGARFAAWSFGGQVPGPTVRVRVGDRVRFTVINRSKERIERLQLDGLLIDRDDERQAIPPGHTLEIEGTAMDAGVHLYRGGLPTAVEAVAAGMFGMLIIDPAEGFTTPVDREYVVVQSELYARAAPAVAAAGKARVEVLDGVALASKRPSKLAYNGRFGQAGGLRLEAEPGERLRLFVVNAGPHAAANFQLSGVPFARVWPASVLGTPPKPAGPAVIEPGAGAIVEVTVPRKGRFPFADQQLGSLGLVGVIDAALGEPATPAPPPPRPRTAAERRQRGKELFSDRCVNCHETRPGMMRMAPDLAGVHQRRSREWLVQWLTDPPKMQAEDAVAKQLLREWNGVPMPQMMLSPDQIEWLLEFLVSAPAPSATKKG
jgi:nitrite reductase (NO-forming)